MNLKDFNWGKTSPWYKEVVGNEIFKDRIYEKFFSVEEGDIVFDVGATIGDFSYSILQNNPSKIYCIEPFQIQLDVCKLNIPSSVGVYIPYGIGDEDNTSSYINYNKSECPVKTFKTIIKEYDIKKIDFLKTDCEGGEYSIFNVENLCWLKDNVKKISGEWHLSRPKEKQKFREFRDVFLRVFPNHEIYSCDDINIKWDLWNEHFIEYYNQIIVYIDNR